MSIVWACVPTQECVRVDVGPTKTDEGEPVVRFTHSATLSNCHQSQPVNVTKTVNFTYKTPTASYEWSAKLETEDKAPLKAEIESKIGKDQPGSSFSVSTQVGPYIIEGHHKRTFKEEITEYEGQQWKYDHEWTYTVEYGNEVYWTVDAVGSTPCEGWTSGKTGETKSTVNYPLGASAYELIDGPNVYCGEE